MFKVLVSCLVAVFATAAGASTLMVNPKRTVYVEDVIGPQALPVASAIYKLSTVSADPIYIVINSPGGDVMAGLQIISAMHIAQNRGVTIRCVVPVMAASMAFQIFANCDERYALHYSMLLWHPMRTVVNGGVTGEDMLYMGESTRELELPMLQQLQAVLHLPQEQFLYHYQHETLWLAEQLLPLTPSFLELVDDIQGIKKPFIAE